MANESKEIDFFTNDIKVGVIDLENDDLSKIDMSLLSNAQQDFVNLRIKQLMKKKLRQQLEEGVYNGK